MTQGLSDVSRREDRIFVALPVTLRTAREGGTEIHGNTVDYSKRGLRVRANLPVPIGQDDEVFVSRNGDQPQKYLVTWVREKVQGQACYELGLLLQ